MIVEPRSFPAFKHLVKPRCRNDRSTAVYVCEAYVVDGTQGYGLYVTRAHFGLDECPLTGSLSHLVSTVTKTKPEGKFSFFTRSFVRVSGTI